MPSNLPLVPPAPPSRTAPAREADAPSGSESGAAPTRRARVDWTNLSFLITAHALAVVAIVYMAAVHFSWWTVLLACVMGTLAGLGITGGYHRHFSHRTYEAHWTVRLFYLLFGAAAVQNSALKWSADHRRHHARTDRDGDPYNISRGFWWAHIGWVCFEDGDRSLHGVADLQADRLVSFQHRYYLPIAILMGAVLPAAIAALWGDWLGGLLVAGFLRLVLLWHAAFAVNSVAHTIGTQPFSVTVSARDSFITALVTLGEGYHNFHHRFQRDYRNGIRWFHLDPTKWFVWSLSKVGLAWNLKRTPDELIRRARESVRATLEEREPGRA